MFEAEDYQALFNELGGEQNPAAVTPEVTPTATVTAEPENNTTPEGAPITPEVTPEVTPEADPNPTGVPAIDPAVDEENQKQARAFAELRTTNAKYTKVFKQLQNSMGVSSEDEVIERLLNAGLNAQARQQNVDPELLKRMQTLEEQNTTMMIEQKQKAVVESFGLLQKDFSLTNDEVLKFAKELDDKGVDLFKAGVDISTLYRGLHHSDIVQKQIEAEKQKWIAEGSVAANAPGVTTTTGKRNSQGKTEINTMGELESLFNSIKK